MHHNCTILSCMHIYNYISFGLVVIVGSKEEMERLESLFVEGLYNPLQPSTSNGRKYADIILTQAAEEEQLFVLLVNSSSVRSLSTAAELQSKKTTKTTQQKRKKIGT